MMLQSTPTHPAAYPRPVTMRDTLPETPASTTGGFQRVLALTSALIAFGAGLIVIAAAGLPERAAFTGQIINGERVAPEVGALAPPFERETLDGSSLSLRDLRGSPVILNFWATWCEPCRVEMPILQALYEDAATQPGDHLHVVGVNLGESPSTIRTWVNELALSFDIVLDPSGGLSRLYYLLGQPTTYIIAPDGRITHVFHGPVSEDRLRRALAPHLG